MNTPPITDLQQLRELVSRCLQLLEQYVSAPEDAESIRESEAWKHCFGSDSVIAVLSKLVSMQKSLMEQERVMADYAVDDTLDSEPMTNEDWEILELCVERWREGKKN